MQVIDNQNDTSHSSIDLNESADHSEHPNDNILNIVQNCYTLDSFTLNLNYNDIDKNDLSLTEASSNSNSSDEK